MAIDPICKMDVDTAKFTSEHKGKKYYFFIRDNFINCEKLCQLS
ncbi:MAG: YHS domain-containing protein [ANME-2 cluster archaeon]|nr:MAG: YHS domain-containing protein [ANME-2 cluster archaeon]